MSRVIQLHPKPVAPIDYLTCHYADCPELERRILAVRYDLADEQIDSILEDRKRRVRAQRWLRLKADVLNWSGLGGEMVLLAVVLVGVAGLFCLGAWLGYRP